MIIKKLWHDPVWSKVIASAIIAACAFITTYFLDWWPSIGLFISQCFNFAQASTSIPNWLLLALILFSLPFVILLGALIWQKVFSQNHPESLPSWKTYTSDLFFGLRWRWKYDSNGGIYDTHTFCPHCDFQVYAQNGSSFRMIDQISFHCESCGRHLGEFHESFDLLENKTKRFIQQKIRNGTWLTQMTQV